MTVTFKRICYKITRLTTYVLNSPPPNALPASMTNPLCQLQTKEVNHGSAKERKQTSQITAMQ